MNGFLLTCSRRASATLGFTCSRRASATLGRVARAATLAVFSFASIACDARLASDLSEVQANEILVALHSAGIAGEKEPSSSARGVSRYEVDVPEGDVAHALAILEAAELPRREEAGVDEAFSEGGLIPTATEERARLLAALGGELARTLERIDGVVDARVHVALPESRETLLDETPPSPRASVLVKHRLDHPPPDADAIRAIIAGAVHGLDEDAVSVLTVVAEPAPSGPALVHLGPVAVTRGSAGLLKGVLVASLAVHVLLASLLVLVLRRHRSPRRVGPRSA